MISDRIRQYQLFPMLTFMRKHASSWLIKTVLGLIILTFILFFGYTRLTDRSQDSRQFVARVGDHHISRKKYDINLEATMKRFQESMKDGGFPDGLRGFVEQNVLQQLVQRELMSQYALKFPISISDEEVATTIKDDKNIFPDGKFDLMNYREKFLPFYRNAYGENFEDAIRRQLLIEKMGVVIDQIYTPWHDELQKSLAALESKKTLAGKTDKKGGANELSSPTPLSIDPNQLFTLWIDRYREQIKVETYLKP